VSRRRRALLLAGLALALGGVAASDVAGREAKLRRESGPPVAVVVARRPLPAGRSLRPGDLAVRRVPARYAPAGAARAPGALVGRRLGAAVPAGADVTPIALAGPAQGGEPGAPVRSGERVADVVAVGSPQLIAPHGRVDVLVTTEARPSRPGRTFVALEDVEVLSVAPGERGGGAGEAVGPRVAAALRVSARQAVFLAAAQSFARELRLLPRAPGDHRHGLAGLSAGSDLDG
jgi:pilus assembly protein CpaB